MKIILSNYVDLGLHGVLEIREYKYHSFINYSNPERFNLSTQLRDFNYHISLSPVDMMDGGGVEPHTFTSRSDLYQ